MKLKVNEGYESLAGVLQRALDQAQNGKGAERHANALPFHKQPMQTIASAHGVGFLTGQASKKGEECHGLPHAAKIAELLGAINYLAGAVIFIEGQPVPAAESAPVAMNDNAEVSSDTLVAMRLNPEPIVNLKRLNELPSKALDMVASSVAGEKLRRQADALQGRHNIDTNCSAAESNDNSPGCGLIGGCLCSGACQRHGRCIGVHPHG